MDWGPPVSSVHGDFPGQNIGVGCHSLLQGIFQVYHIAGRLWATREDYPKQAFTTLGETETIASTEVVSNKISTQVNEFCVALYTRAQSKN